MSGMGAILKPTNACWQTPFERQVASPCSSTVDTGSRKIVVWHGRGEECGVIFQRGGATLSGTRGLVGLRIVGRHDFHDMLEAANQQPVQSWSQSIRRQCNKHTSSKRARSSYMKHILVNAIYGGPIICFASKYEGASPGQSLAARLETIENGPINQQPRNVCAPIATSNSSACVFI